MQRGDWIKLVREFNCDDTISTNSPFLKISDLVNVAENMCQSYEEVLLYIESTVQELQQHRQNILNSYNVLETITIYIPETKLRLQRLKKAKHKHAGVYQQMHIAVDAYRSSVEVKEYINQNYSTSNKYFSFIQI